MPRGSRAAAFVAGAGLVAWLAAAADRQPSLPASRPARDTSSLARAERLAQDIQSQAMRLRTRLAAAPQPAPSGRNPFSLQAPAAPARSARASAALNEPPGTEAISVPEPEPFTLSGIAEEIADAAKPAPPVRTAILSGFGEVFLARAGETIASRYEITVVGADAVEMKDLATGRTIRLGLR